MGVSGVCVCVYVCVCGVCVACVCVCVVCVCVYVFVCVCGVCLCVYVWCMCGVCVCVLVPRGYILHLSLEYFALKEASCLRRKRVFCDVHGRQRSVCVPCVDGGVYVCVDFGLMQVPLCPDTLTATCWPSQQWLSWQAIPLLSGKQAH